MKKKTGLTGLLAIFVLLGLLRIGSAEEPQGSYFHPGGEPTGSLSQIAFQSGVDGRYFQPIRFNLPKGTKVSIASEGRFFEGKTPCVFGMRPTSVYRLRFSDIPLHPEKDLYPTIEVLNRTFPPEGKEFDFPVVVEVTQEDLNLALAGNLVIRVIYLEDPKNAIPIDSEKGRSNLSFEVSHNADPIATAERLGPIMAILRIGNRIPLDEPNPHSPFYFGLPPFTVR